MNIKELAQKHEQYIIDRRRFYHTCPELSLQEKETIQKIRADLILRTRDMLNKILSEKTGQPIERIEKDTDRDNFLSAADACEYGLVDKVIDRR